MVPNCFQNEKNVFSKYRIKSALCKLAITPPSQIYMYMIGCQLYPHRCHLPSQINFADQYSSGCNSPLQALQTTSKERVGSRVSNQHAFPVAHEEDGALCINLLSAVYLFRFELVSSYAPCIEPFYFWIIV